MSMKYKFKAVSNGAPYEGVVELEEIVDPTPNPPQSSVDPASVLVIVNDDALPEKGTNGQNASKWVAAHYMTARNIPAKNQVHINTGEDFVNTMLTEVQYHEQVTRPILAKLTDAIRYIVPCHGVPVVVMRDGWGQTSLDSKLMALRLPPFVPAGANMSQNPYYNADPASSPSSDTKGVLLVSRLDARSATVAAALVDKALAGEANGVHGTGYFDWQGIGTEPSLGYPQKQDYSVLNAYNLCPGPRILNNQQASGSMIKSAPNTSWAWGWYDLGATNAAAYSFVPGAVGTQLNSGSASCFLCPDPAGNYASKWLDAGITAVWGAVAEPYADYYTLGDNLLSHLWRGYSLGEAFAIATPTLHWEMMCVGDPLYRPKMT